MTKLHLHSILLFFISLSTTGLLAQHPYFYKIDVLDGLPSNEIYELLQDSFGYIWIGSSTGLFRYDGFTVKQYKSKQAKSRAISYLKQDSLGNIWCNNFSGQIFKVSGDSLQVMLANEDNCLYGISYNISPDNRVFVMCGTTLTIYDLEGKLLKQQTFHSKDFGPYPSDTWIGSICWQDNIPYLFFGRSGMYKYIEKEERIERVYAPDDRISKSSPLRQENIGGRIWMGQNLTTTNSASFGGHLIELRNDSLFYRYRITKNPTINKIVQGLDHELFFVGNFGAILYDQSQASSFEITTWLFPDIRISDVLRDREGNYWFSSLDNGIYVCPSLSIKKIAPKQTICANALALSDNGRLWVGSSKGELYYIDQNDKKQTIFREKKQFSGAIQNIYYHPQDSNIYISGNQGVTLNSYHPEAPLGVSGSCRYLVRADSLIYLSDRSGVVMIDANDLSHKKRIKHTSTRAIELDTLNKTLWSAVSSGLELYKNDSAYPFLLNAKKVYAAALDYHDGIVWVASLDDGIYGFEREVLKYHFNIENGLRFNEMKKLLVWEEWIFATAGKDLYRIHIPSKKVEYFSTNLGIIAQDIEDMEIRDKNLYLATNKGIFKLPIHHTAFNTVAPNIQLVQLSLEDSIIAIQKEKAIQLPYKHGTFKIHLTSTAFRSRGKFHYEYRIKGLSNYWSKLTAENNYVSLTALPPGYYQVEVYAVNENGVRSSSPVTVAVKVESPIWQKWWFIFLVFIFLVSIILGIGYLRWRIIAKRLFLEQQLTKSQLVALKAQMNPHFLYNALNSIQDLILTNDIRNTNRYLNKFSNLMRKVLNGSNHDETRLEKEIELLSLYLDLEKLRFGKDFSYQIKVDPQLDSSRQNIVSMVIQPFAENAVKHGLLHKKGNKHILIEFQIDKNQLKCIVEDNGIGRKRANEIKKRDKRHTSFATAATAKRLEILSAYYKDVIIGLEVIDLYDDDKNALGTRVELYLPLYSETS